MRVSQRFSWRRLHWLSVNGQLLDEAARAVVEIMLQRAGRPSHERAVVQKVEYSLSSASEAGRLGFGRLYASHVSSLERIPRKVRGTIAGEYYHDLDIVNCHPVLLLQLAERLSGLPVTRLRHLVEHRDDALKTIAADRTAAKEQALAALYGAAVNSPVLCGLSQEARGIGSRLQKHADWAPLFASCATHEQPGAAGSPGNVAGRFLALVLQTEDRRCMLAMKDALERRSWSVDVLAYDGVMVRRRRGHACDGDLLRGVERDVFTATGYRVALVEKPMESFDVADAADPAASVADADEAAGSGSMTASPEPSAPAPRAGPAAARSATTEVAKGVSRARYDEKKAAFEASRFYHIPTNQYVELGADGGLAYMDERHAREYFGIAWHFQSHSGDFRENVPFFDVWRKDPSRRAIRTVDYRPSSDPSVFSPPLVLAHAKSAAPLDPSAHLAIFQRLVDVNTGGRPALKTWFVGWLAHLLQRPLELPGVAVVLSGGKGTGKDTLLDFFMEYVLGPRYSQNYESNRQFFDAYDTGRNGKLLVKLEEADRNLCHENSSTLKSYITAQTATYNPKGRPAFSASNFARFAFTTNKANPVDVQGGERRFVVMPCSAELKGDFGFWAECRRVLFSDAGGRAVADWLLAVDLAGFEVRQLPQNDYQDEVVDAERPVEDRFVEQWEGAEVDAKELYVLYESFCSGNSGGRRLTSSMSLAKNMVSFVRDGKVATRVARGGRKLYRKPRGALDEGASPSGTDGAGGAL